MHSTTPQVINSFCSPSGTSLPASEAENHQAISIHIKNQSLGNKSSAYYCYSSSWPQFKNWLSIFCTAPIATRKEQKGIAGANDSSSSGVVCKGGLRGKSRLEKRMWDSWEVPKLFGCPSASLLWCWLGHYPTAKGGDRTCSAVLKHQHKWC